MLHHEQHSMLEEAWKQTVAQIDALADEGRFDEASTRLRNLEFLRPPNGEDADLFARFHLRWAETVEADEPLVAIRLLTIARHAAWQFAAMASGPSSGYPRMKRVNLIDRKLQSLRARVATPPPSDPT